MRFGRRSTLRHTCVSWLLAEDKTSFQVGRHVGMTAQLVERVYGHTNDGLKRETANAIGRRKLPRRGLTIVPYINAKERERKGTWKDENPEKTTVGA
jgi:hypothetical protein